MARIIPRRNPLTASKALLSGTGVVAPPSSFVWEGGNDNTTDVPVQLNVPLDFDAAARIVGEESITLISGSAPGLSYNPTTMRVTGTPTTEGSYSLLFEANDGQGGGGAAADWAARISGAGVVWYHDFSSDEEVNAFRWTGGFSGGNDPLAVGSPRAGNCRRITSDGITGGCLEVLRDAGTAEPSYWWRPFAPLDTGSGKAVNDPAASGSLTVRNWAPTSGGSQLSNFQNGWYGHPSYQSAPYFDGHDFYLQVRVKMDLRRITGGNAANAVGKFVWITTAETAHSLSNGEHVIWSYGNGGNQGAQNYVRVYSLGVNGIGAFDPLDQEEPGARIQPGSDSVSDWYYSGGWDTLLVHLRPGLINTTTGADATMLEIWAAHPGETSYTKIWAQEYGLGGYEARNGLQALILSAYNNSNNFPQAFWHRYAQVIFSKSFIPCPQV